MSLADASHLKELDLFTPLSVVNISFFVCVFGCDLFSGDGVNLKNAINKTQNGSDWFCAEQEQCHLMGCQT